MIEQAILIILLLMGGCTKSEIPKELVIEPIKEVQSEDSKTENTLDNNSSNESTESETPTPWPRKALDNKFDQWNDPSEETANMGMECLKKVEGVPSIGMGVEIGTEQGICKYHLGLLGYWLTYEEFIAYVDEKETE